MKYLFLSALFIFYNFLPIFAFPFKDPEYVDIANSIIENTAEKLSKKYNLEFIGQSESMMDCIHQMGIKLQTSYPLEKDEARRLIINTTEEFLRDINQNEKIRPFLEVYPFTPKNTSMTIFSSRSDNGIVYDPYIVVASIQKGKVVFKTNDPENRYKYKNIYTESYEEALKIVEAEDNLNSKKE